MIEARRQACRMSSLRGRTGHRGRIEIEELAATQGGVVSRTQLYLRGVSRGEVRAHVRARRWQRIGSHCITVHTGPLTQNARLWSAVLEGGPRALLDGALGVGRRRPRALSSQEAIRVSVPRGARIRHRGTSVDIRQTRRWAPDDLEPGGLPRTRVPVAAIRAALWARTNRQATLLLVMTVQQGLGDGTGAQRGDAADPAGQATGTAPRRTARPARRCPVARRARRPARVSRCGASRSRTCRCCDVPPSGTYYLDFRWGRWKLVLEVDGIQHSWVENVVADALRQNSDRDRRRHRPASPASSDCACAPTSSSPRSPMHSEAPAARSRATSPPDPLRRHTNWSPGQPERMTSRATSYELAR